MLRKWAIAAVLLVVFLAQAPSALSTVRSWLGLDNWDDWWRRDAVTSPERAKELAGKGLREQLISFSDGMSSIEYRYGGKADTQRYNIYAIGVGQVTLPDPEKVEKVTVTGSRLPAPRELPDANTLPTYALMGQFNNVLLFDRRTGEMTKLFNERLAISAFQYGWRTTPEVLIIFGTDRDTNRDGKLDDGDLQNIYVYTFADRKMHKIEVPGINPKEIMDIPDADYVVVKGFVDHDRHGGTCEYSYSYSDACKNRRPDPATLVRIDLKTFAATPFVSEVMQKELQDTLDGPKPVAPAPNAPPARASDRNQ